MVATLDYGDLQGCDSHGRKYTHAFSGTSSASPVVVGAVIQVQGISKAERGAALEPRDLRHLLTATGHAQVDGPHGPVSERIGPLPDVARALQVLESR